MIQSLENLFAEHVKVVGGQLNQVKGTFIGQRFERGLFSLADRLNKSQWLEIRLFCSEGDFCMKQPS